MLDGPHIGYDKLQYQLLNTPDDDRRQLISFF